MPFDQHFTPLPNNLSDCVEGIPYQDTALLDTLTTDELEGVLAWMVRGCLDWQSAGTLGAPEAVRNATDEYRRESRPLAGWLEEVALDPDGWEPKTRLYQSYAASAGRDGLSRTDFYAQLRAAEFHEVVRRGMRGFVGLRLPEPDTADDIGPGI